MKIKPNFFIVGAARSGTTSLDRYLSQHPEIYIAPKKEVHFFAAEHFPQHFTGPGDDKVLQRVTREEQEYARLFAGVTTEKAVGEASAFYLCLPNTAQRIAQAVPDARILILLREPVARAYSAYMHLVRDGRECVGFVEALKLEEERKQRGYEPLWWYKELSRYSEQVNTYLQVFGRTHVKVLLYDELFANPGQKLREIFGFLGVKEDVPIDTSVRYNVGGIAKSRRLYSLYTLPYSFVDTHSTLLKRIKSLVPIDLRMAWANKAMSTLVRPVPLDPHLQTQLKPYFAEDVAKLEEVLQRDLLCWCYREPNQKHKVGYTRKKVSSSDAN